MKIVSSTACLVAALIPLVAAFVPGFTGHRPALDLKAAAGGVPDLVAAYKKAKPEPSLPDLPVPAVPEPVQSVAPPQSASFSMPEIKVELPSAPAISADIQSSVSDSVQSAKSSISSINMKATADQINSQFKGVNDFFKASQEQAARVAAERGATSKVPTLGLSVPEGKAPTLVEFIGSGFQSGGNSMDTLAESKAKLALLVDNTFSLFGKSGAGGMDMNLPEGMSPETAAGIAVAGVGLLVIAGQNNRSKPTPAVAVDGKEEATPLSSLAKDVKTMAEQIKLLSQETKDLRKQLKEAREQLSRKDLELGKGRLTTLDGDLKMNRELDKVATKLKASEAKNKALEKELESTAGLQERIKVLEDQLKAAGIGAPAPAPKPKPTPAPKPKPTPAPKPKPTPAPKPEPTPAPKPEPTPAPKPEPTPAPAPEPFFAAEKSPAPKKKAAAPKGSAAKAASPKAAKSPAPKAKKAKAKAKTAAPAPAPGGDDWPSLSKSTLSRKTVIELTEYLSAKGVKTNGEDGKPLKKALLVEAVKAL